MKCVFFRFVLSVLVVGGVACALNKRNAAFGGRGPKDHLLINSLPHPVFSLFTVWLNRVGPLPLVFSLFIRTALTWL